MGALEFEIEATGDTPEEAFKRAVENALYWHGHCGYTGTIAEKDSFILIPVPAEYENKKKEYARKLLDEDDSRINDKWGDAGCIHLENSLYYFFGWVSY